MTDLKFYAGLKNKQLTSPEVGNALSSNRDVGNEESLTL